MPFTGELEYRVGLQSKAFIACLESTRPKAPSNGSVVCLFRNLSAVGVAGIPGIFLRSDAEILHFRDEVESDSGRGDEWPERPSNGGRPLAETEEAHGLVKGL